MRFCTCSTPSENPLVRGNSAWSKSHLLSFYCASESTLLVFRIAVKISLSIPKRISVLQSYQPCICKINIFNDDCKMSQALVTNRIHDFIDFMWILWWNMLFYQWFKMKNSKERFHILHLIMIWNETLLPIQSRCVSRKRSYIDYWAYGAFEIIALWFFGIFWTFFGCCTSNEQCMILQLVLSREWTDVQQSFNSFNNQLYSTW